MYTFSIEHVKHGFYFLQYVAFSTDANMPRQSDFGYAIVLLIYSCQWILACMADQDAYTPN